VSKYYDFLDKPPAIGRLVIIEGTERVFADRALEVVLDRLLPAEVRELNLSRFTPDDLGDLSALREALSSMPFLADRRVVIVTETQTMRADPRRDLWAAAQEIPEGNTLVLLDLLPPRSKRPQSFGSLAGGTALRIDTTADEPSRERFIIETLERLDANADPRAVNALAGGTADLTSVRNDLEKLALTGKKIGLSDLEREALEIGDPKAYEYASALVDGKTAKALAIAHEFLSENARGGVALLIALATECGYLYALSVPGGELPERIRFRERFLRPVARRVGERRLQRAFRHALHGIEAVVTGQSGGDPEDHFSLIDRISVELSRLFAR
jgi:DNA polymerase III delta subunit